MGYSFGGDILSTNAGATISCVSTAQGVAHPDIQTPASWSCSNNKCQFKGGTLRNWVGGCATANDCRTSVIKSSATCEPLKQCRMGLGLGGGEPKSTKCTSSWDCKDKTYLKDNMFKCDTGTSQVGANQAGGSGICKFSITEASYEQIPDFPTNWCVEDSDCRVAWLREGLNCGGPRFAVSVRGE